VTNFQQLAIEELLKSELGERAEFWPYQRNNRTPMNFVLDKVQDAIGNIFSVYWVSDGPPEVFTVTGFENSPVVFSTRYLGLSAFLRHLLVDRHLETILTDVARRACLKLIAELSLRHGDPEFAVIACVASLIDKGVWLNDDDQLQQLEYEPINERYMATWFFGLSHELGHLATLSWGERIKNEDGLFSDAWMLEAIKHAISKFPYPEWVKSDAVNEAKNKQSDSVLEINHLRNEGLADFFATSVMLASTVEIMKLVNTDPPFSSVRFVQETVIFFNIIAIFDRCRSTVSALKALSLGKKTFHGAGIDSLLQPVAVHVRARMQREYLESAITEFLYGRDAALEEVQLVQKMIDEVYKSFESRIDSTETGMAKAMEYALFPKRRELDIWTLLEGFRENLLHSPLPLARLEAERFSLLAEKLQKKGELLRALKRILDSPDDPLQPDNHEFIVPWVKGPDDFDAPFSLRTKFGDLVFVFHVGESELCRAFFKESAEMMAPSFTLASAIVCVPWTACLEYELATRMADDKRIRVVLEGTDLFASYMRELCDGTIWEEAQMTVAR